nr:MAG TPA: hypothetical protein [Caudoviricetes sp.]
MYFQKFHSFHNFEFFNELLFIDTTKVVIIFEIARLHRTFS